MNRKAVVFFAIGLLAVSGLISLASASEFSTSPTTASFTSSHTTTGSGVFTWSGSNSLGTSYFRGGNATLDTLQLYIVTGSSYFTASVSEADFHLSTASGYSSWYNYSGFLPISSKNIGYLDPSFSNLATGNYTFSLGWSITDSFGASATYDWYLTTISNRTEGGGSTIYSQAPATMKSQLPYGTYTLPQFAPFDNFGYNTRNVSIAWSNTTTPSLLLDDTGTSSGTNYLASNQSYSTGSYYVNGSISSSTPDGSIAFGQRYLATGTTLFRYMPALGRVDTGSMVGALAPTVTSAVAYYYTLVNSYNNTIEISILANSTWFNGTFAAPDTAISHFQIQASESGNIRVSIPTITQKTYPVNFTEEGIPVGGLWSLTVNGHTYTQSQTYRVVDLTTGSYSYSGGAGVYSAAGIINVTGDASSYSANVNFFAGSTLKLTINTTGYSNSYNIILNGNIYTVKAPSSSILLVNGTYTFQVNSPYGYSSSAPSSISLTTSNVTVDVGFTVVARYLNFSETGLPSGTQWTVYTNASSQSSVGPTISFFLYRTTYTFVVQAFSGYTSSTSVSSPYNLQSNTTVTVTYSPIEVHLRFSSNMNSYTIHIGSNSYAAGSVKYLNLTFYNVAFSASLAGYTPDYSPSAYINSSLYQNFTINFKFTGYTITFVETGYSHQWSVWLGNTQYTSSTNTIRINVAPGTYTFQVQGIKGFAINPAIWNGYIGSNITVNVQITVGGVNPSTAIFGGYDFVYAIMTIGIAIFVGLAVISRRKG